MSGSAHRRDWVACGVFSPSSRGRMRAFVTGAAGALRAGTVVSCGEEDDMSDTTPALDEAYERIAAASFELPNGFVNHGAMACEALAVLDCADDIDSWARRFAQAGGARIEPVASASFQWPQALGAYDHLPEWIGYFARAIDAADTAPRRGELARALGYWAARYRAGQPTGPHGPAEDSRAAVVRAAADGARRYLARPNIL